MTCLGRAVLTIALTVCSTGVAVGQTPTAPAAVDTTGLAWARKLLEERHVQQALLAGLDSAFATQRKGIESKGSKVYFDSLTARLHRESPQLVDSLAGLWAGQLSPADLQSLVKFYQTPLGKRYADAEVAVDLQTKAIAQRWGMRLGIDVMRDLVDKGLISPSDLSH